MNKKTEYILTNIFIDANKKTYISNHSRQGYDPIQWQRPIFFDALAKRLLYGINPKESVYVLSLSNCLEDTLSFEKDLGYTGAVDKLIPLFENINEVIDSRGYVDYEKYEYKLFDLLKTTKSLFMAAPINDKGHGIYAIPYSKVEHINDKDNLLFYVDESYLPTKYITIKNTIDFLNDKNSCELLEAKLNKNYPLMVKACELSSGQGVFKCNSIEDIVRTLKSFKSKLKVIIEEYIDHKPTNSFGVQYSISATGVCNTVGIAYQLLDGVKYKGSLFKFHMEHSFIENEACNIVLEKILPKISSNGIYGYGSVDLIIGINNEIKVLEINHRMTGAISGINRKDTIKDNIAISLTLHFNKGKNSNRKIIKKIIKKGIADPNGLSEYGNEAILNTIIIGSSKNEIQKKISKLNTICEDEMISTDTILDYEI